MSKKLSGKALQKYNNLYREMDEFYHTLAVQSGLSDSAFFILYTICEYGDGCLQRDICDIACLSKQTIHSAIRKLEQAGYLYLEEGKGRDKHIHLTEQGRSLIEEKIVPVVMIENAAFAALEEAETTELLRLTEKYLQLLHKELQRRI